jgi:hypothetical protein
MASQTQTYATHRRYHPMWHFFAFPVLLLNVFASAWHVIRHPSPWNAWGVVIAAALLIAVFAARVQTLTVQNRVIRLEMRLHLRDVLPAAMHGRIAELTVKQLIGLRFASDAELPSLVERCLKGELKDDEAVKKAITDWRADHTRA